MTAPLDIGRGSPGPSGSPGSASDARATGDLAAGPPELRGASMRAGGSPDLRVASGRAGGRRAEPDRTFVAFPNEGAAAGPPGWIERGPIRSRGASTVPMDGSGGAEAGFRKMEAE